ncbi:MAG: Flp family type IVb pilin [Firmicutes bacterium]|nr:Flp family type IVb pilin [Bacillota bacterium]
MKRCREKVVGTLTLQVSAVAHSERGATSAEYALVLALVVVTLITALSALGAALNDKLHSIIEQISNAR